MFITLLLTKKTKTTKVDSRLIPIDSSLPMDPKVNEAVEKWMEIAYKSFRDSGFDPTTVVAKVDIPLDGRESTNRYEQTNLGAVLTKAMLQSSRKSAQAAIVNSGSIRLDDQLFGDITEFDIIRSIPYGGAVYDVEIEGHLLNAVLQEGESKKGEGAYLQRTNLTYDEQQKVWKIENQPILDDKIYTVVLSDFLLKGFDINVLKEGVPGLINIHRPDPADKSDLRNDIRLAVIEYLKNRR